MSTTGRDIESGPRARGPLDHEIEVGPLAVGLALPVSLRPIVPDGAHGRESSTARFAASSIVAST